MDQPFWAARLVDLGVAPGRRNLTVDWLAGALRAATTDPRYLQRAQELSTALAQENGAAAVVRFVERSLQPVAGKRSR